MDGCRGFVIVLLRVLEKCSDPFGIRFDTLDVSRMIVASFDIGLK